MSTPLEEDIARVHVHNALNYALNYARTERITCVLVSATAYCEIWKRVRADVHTAHMRPFFRLTTAVGAIAVIPSKDVPGDELIFVTSALELVANTPERDMDRMRAWRGGEASRRQPIAGSDSGLQEKQS